MKRIATVPAAFALMAIFACSDGIAPDGVEPLFHHGGDHMVPFKGTVAGQNADINSGPSAGCPVGLFPITLEAAGNTTHLGKITEVQAHCLNPIPIAFDPITFQFSGGELTITAANGDELFKTYSGLATVIGGQTFMEGDATVTGGTGRFSGASGGFHFSGEIEDADNQFVASVDGSISSVGSSRP